MTATPVGPRTASSRPPVADSDSIATLALSARAASVLAYSAGCLSGALVLALEGQRVEVRRHAAQALLGFGLLTLMSVALLALAGAALFVSVGLFRVLLWVAQGVIVAGVIAWVVALVQTARGLAWRWPFLAHHAERLASLGRH